MTTILNTADAMSAINSSGGNSRWSTPLSLPSASSTMRFIVNLNGELPLRQCSEAQNAEFTKKSAHVEQDEQIHPADCDFAKAACKALFEKFQEVSSSNELLKASMQFRLVAPNGKMRLVNQVLTPLQSFSHANPKVSVVETDLTSFATNPVKVVRIFSGDGSIEKTLDLNGFDSGQEACPFSDRQLQILRLLAEGGTTAEVSKSLFISSDTVRTHRQHILQRSAHANMTSTVVDCVRKGWI